MTPSVAAPGDTNASGTALILLSCRRLGLERLIDAYACVISELNDGNDLELVDIVTPFDRVENLLQQLSLGCA